MKVLVFRSRSTDPTINKYCSALADSGYDVTLLVWDRKNNLEKNKFNNLDYHIVWFNFQAPLDSLFTIFYLPFWWLFMITTLLKRSFEIVHLCDLDTLFPGIFVKCFFNKKIVYTIFDFYADNIPNGYWMSLRTSLRKIIAFTERWLIRFCDLLVLVDESRNDEVMGAKIKHIIYVYNSPPDLLNKSIADKKVPSQILEIFYAGILLNVRGIQYMIQAVSELEGVSLVLGGSLVDVNLNNIQKKLDNKIHYVGWIPSYQQVIEMTLHSDVLFRFSDPLEPKTKNESPNKLFEAMMCQKPIIVSDCSAMANIVRKERCGVVVPYGDVELLKKEIIKLKNDRNYYFQLAENGRKAYEKTYNWDIMSKRLVDAYKSLFF